MIKIKALSAGDIDTAQMNKLGDMAKNMGMKYGISPTEVAEGMQDLVKAGIKGNVIPGIYEEIIKTSKGAGEALGGEEGVAARMTDMMLAWGIQANQVGRMGDILARGAVQSTVSFRDLSESMKYSQGTLKNLNFTFEESVAMMAILGNSGIKASMAGTSLQHAWQKMSSTLGSISKNKNAITALKMMGLTKADLEDQYGNIRRPLDIMDKMKKGLQGLSNIQRVDVLKQIFGDRGGRAVNPLITFLEKGPNDKFMGLSFQEMVADLTNNSAGSNNRLVSQVMQSPAERIKQLQASVETMKINLGNAMLPMLAKLLPIITRVVNAFANFFKSGAGRTFADMMIAAAPLLVVMGGMLTVTSLIGKSLINSTGLFTSFATAGKWALNTLIGRGLTFASIMGGVGPGQGINKAGNLFDTATGRMVKGGFGVGNSSGVMTPLIMSIGEVLIPLGLLAGAAYALYKIFDLFGPGPGSNQSLSEMSFPERLAFEKRTGTGGMNKYDTNIHGADNQFHVRPITVNLHVDGKKAITKHINSKDENDAHIHYSLSH